jgi:capsule polysaccharide export protein KpsE/RkpR
MSTNPFQIEIEIDTDKNDVYTIDDYIRIQKQLDNINIDELVTELYNTSSPPMYFYNLQDFHKRCSRGIKQKIMDETA